MALVDIRDWYVSPTGALVRWMRSAPGSATAPTAVTATIVGTTLTVNWQPPASDGGTPITSYVTSVEVPSGVAGHTPLATARSDTFTVTAGLSLYRVTVAAVTSTGAGAVATATTSATAAVKFPGYHRTKLEMLNGIDELDKDPTTVSGDEVAAPETNSGVRAAAIRYYFKGTWSAIMGVPNGQWASAIKTQYASGRICIGSMNVMSAGDDWITAANGSQNAVFDAWIAWCEETAPDYPIPMSFNHEPNFTATVGSRAADFGHFMRYFRSRMDVYAAAHGGVGVYRWKHLSFGPIHTAQDYAQTTSKGAVQPSWDAAAKITATAAASTDTFTSTGHLLANGRKVTLLAPPAGLTTTATYYVVGATANTFQLAATLGGAAVNVTADGSGITVISTDVYDWMGADPYVSRGGNLTPYWTSNMDATVKWCEAAPHVYPLAFTEFAIYNRDPTAATKLQQVYDRLLDGTHDIWAVLYYNSGDQTYLVNGVKQPLYYEFYLDNVSNGRLLDKYVSLMSDPRCIHPWDLGFAKPPGA